MKEKKYQIRLLILVMIIAFGSLLSNVVLAERIHIGGGMYPIFQNYLLLNSGNSEELVRIGFGRNEEEVYWDNINGRFTITDDLLIEGGIRAGIDTLVVNADSGNVGIGVAVPGEKLEVGGNVLMAGNLTVGGGISAPVRNVYIDGYMLTDQDFTVVGDTTGFEGDLTWNLPEAGTAVGRIYVVKLIQGEKDILIVPFGLEKIDGAVNYSLQNPKDYVIIQSSGSEWIVIGRGY